MRLAAARETVAPDGGVRDRDNHGGGEYQERQDEKEVDRPADGSDELARKEAAEDRAERRSGADETEQAFGLPSVEQGVGETPRLHRRNDPETVHPDIEHAGEQPEGIRVEQPPEQQHIGGKKQQRPDRDGPLAKARCDTGINGHEDRQRQGDGGVDVDQRVRTVLPQEQGRCGSAWREERTRRQPRYRKGERDREGFSGPNVEKTPQTRPMSAGQFTSVVHGIGSQPTLFPMSSAIALAYRRGPRRRKHHRADDVRVFVPGDDGLQRHQADDAVEVHLRSGCGQPAVCHARRRVCSSAS